MGPASDLGYGTFDHSLSGRGGSAQPSRDLPRAEPPA